MEKHINFATANVIMVSPYEWHASSARHSNGTCIREGKRT